MNNRFLGGYIRHYHEGTGVPLRTKLTAIAVLWLTIGYSAIFVAQQLWVRALLVAVAAAVTIHLATLRPRGR